MYQILPKFFQVLTPVILCSRNYYYLQFKVKLLKPPIWHLRPLSSLVPFYQNHPENVLAVSKYPRPIRTSVTFFLELP